MCLSNTVLHHKPILRYTWTRKNKKKLGYIAVGIALKRDILDAVVRGMFNGSGYFMVVEKVWMRIL